VHVIADFECAGASTHHVGNSAADSLEDPANSGILKWPEAPNCHYHSLTFTEQSHEAVTSLGGAPPMGITQAQLTASSWASQLPSSRPWSTEKAWTFAGEGGGVTAWIERDIWIVRLAVVLGAACNQKMR